MSTFTGSLIIEEIKPGLRWKVLQPIHYEIGYKGSSRWVIIPEGFETDGASIPVFLRPFLSVWGTYGRAACLHDYLYFLMREPRNESAWSRELTRQRRFADAEFYTAMIACGTAKPLALLMWAAVRVFGDIGQKTASC